MYLWYHAPTVSRTYGITYLRGQTSVCPSPLSALGAARMGDPSAAARFIGRPERGVLRQWGPAGFCPSPPSALGAARFIGRPERGVLRQWGPAGFCPSPPSALGAARFIGRPERGVLRQWGPAGFCPSPPSALGAARMGGPSAASCASKVQGALACNSACSWAI
jgi:hypothetical protein